jgi:hypothetical protein
MRAFGLEAEASKEAKDRVCDVCELHNAIILKHFNITSIKMSSLLTQESYDQANALSSRMAMGKAVNFSIGNVQVGRLSLFEVLIGNKKMSLNFSKEQQDLYRFMLNGSLLTLFAITKLIEKENPDRFIVYNAAYSSHNTCIQCAEGYGKPAYFIHGSLNIPRAYKDIVVGRGNYPAAERYLLKLWNEHYRDVAIGRPQVERVLAHLFTLFDAKSPFVYSSPLTGRSNIRRLFGIRPDQKILVASLSSYDEMFAANMIGARQKNHVYSSVFHLQTDWIEALTCFMRENPDLFLLVRVHPREFPNKREGVLSEHAQLLKERFVNFPDNMRVNWPSDKVSIYDLAEEMDVLLNCYSSVGVEMSLLGIPVVVYDSNMLGYPPDLNYHGTSADEYFNNIWKAIEEGWKFERLRMAWRWLSLLHWQSVYDMSNSIKYNSPPPNAHLVDVDIDGRRFSVYQQELDCIRRSKKHGLSDVATMMERGNAVLAELNERIDCYGTTADEENASLHFALSEIYTKRYSNAVATPSSGTLRYKLDSYIKTMREL